MVAPRTAANRAVARIVILLACAAVVFAAGIAVLVGTGFGGKSTKEWVGAALIAAGVGLASLVFFDAG